MSEVTIPKTEYVKLRRRAAAYEKLLGVLFQAVARDPIDEVVEDFRATGVYTDAFLRDLGDGLRKSSYQKTERI